MMGPLSVLRRAVPAACVLALCASLLGGCNEGDSESFVTTVDPDDPITVVNSWLVAGTFPSPDLENPQEGGPWRAGLMTDYLTSLGGEGILSLRGGTRDLSAIGDSASLITMHTWPRGYANLMDLFGQQRNVVVYLYAEIEVEDTLRTQIHIGGTDAFRAWLGGVGVANMLHDSEGEVGASQTSMCVTLPPGKTPLLVKVDKAGGPGWGVYAAFLDTEAHPDAREQLIADFAQYWRYPREDFMRVVAQYGEGDQERFIAALDSLMAEHPGSRLLKKRTDEYLLKAYARAGRSFEDVTRLAREVVRNDPGRYEIVADAYHLLGTCPETALAYADTALDIARKRCQPYPALATRDVGRIQLLRGETLSALGRHDEATAALRATRDSIGHEGAMRLGAAYERAGQPDEALACYMDVLRRYCSHSLAREAVLRLSGDDPAIEDRLGAMADSCRSGRFVQRDPSRVNVPLPEFWFETLAHDTVTNESLRGKIAVLQYWSTHAYPMGPQLPQFQQAYERLRDRPDVVFLAINPVGERDSVASYVSEHGCTMPIGIGHPPDGLPFGWQLAMSLHIGYGLPAPFTVIVAPDNTVRYWLMGPREADGSLADDVVRMVNWVADES